MHLCVGHAARWPLLGSRAAALLAASHRFSPNPERYRYHGAPRDECGTNAPGDAVTDFSNSTAAAIAPAAGLNGTYRCELFSAEAVRLIHAHGAGLRAGTLATSTPMYMYLAYHNVHGAAYLPALSLQAPLPTVRLHNRTRLDTYKVAGAIVTELDAGVAAIVEALEAAGLLPNAMVAFCSDNSSPLDHATNAPLRGGKHTLWEGGVRATAWVYSPLLPSAVRGSVWPGMMHAADWLLNVCGGCYRGLAGNSHRPSPLGRAQHVGRVAGGQRDVNAHRGDPSGGEPVLQPQRARLGGPLWPDDPHGKVHAPHPELWVRPSISPHPTADSNSCAAYAAPGRRVLQCVPVPQHPRPLPAPIAALFAPASYHTAGCSSPLLRGTPPFLSAPAPLRPITGWMRGHEMEEE